MSSVQHIRSKVQECEGTGTSIFPQDVTTEEQSLIFVKKLIAVGISSITYLRMIFPESSYKNTWADGLNLKLLMDESASPGANMLISWIKGCFDAIENKYLREMTLSVYGKADEPEKVLETYTFKFSYADSGEVQLCEMIGNASTGQNSSQKYEVKKPTFKMIRTIIMLTQSMESLPRVVHLSMKLHYYEQVTPSDYEPPGFQQCLDESFIFQDGSVNLKVGEVATPFHGVKLRAIVDTSQFSLGVERRDPASGEENKEHESDSATSVSNCVSPASDPSQSIVESQMDRDAIIRQGKVRRRLSVKSLPRSLSHPTPELEAEESKTEATPNNSPLSHSSDSFRAARCTPKTLLKGALMPMYDTPNVDTPKLNDILSNNSGSSCSIRSVSVDLAPTYSKEYPVRCPCGVNSDEGLMVLCDVCGYWQHGACFTILEGSQAPSKHYCEQCADPPSLCTDPRLCWADPTKVYTTCLYRRALVVASQLDGKVSSAIIAHKLGVNISLGTKIIDKLTNDKVLKIGNNGTTKIVDMDELKNFAYPKYFNKKLGQSSQEMSAPNSQLERSKAGIESLSLLDSTNSEMTIDVMNCSMEEDPYASQGKASGSSSKGKATASKSIASFVSANGTAADDVNATGAGKENKLPMEREKRPSKLRRGKRKLAETEAPSSPAEITLSLQSNDELFDDDRKRKKTSKSKSIRV